MNVKKIGVLVLTLIVGLLVVSAVSAQAETPEPPQPPQRPFLNGNRPGNLPNGNLGQFEGNGLLRELVNIVTASLNMEPSEILQQLRTQTLAEVITANSGSVDDITAQITAAVTDRVNEAVANGNLTQERADEVVANLDDNVQKALNGELRGLMQGQGAPRGQQLLDRLDMRAPLMSAIMDATGLNGRDLAEEIRSGSTLSDVITAHGGDPDAVIVAAIAQVTARLDGAVANGNLTQEQETRIIEGAQAFYAAALTATRPVQVATPAGV